MLDCIAGAGKTTLLHAIVQTLELEDNGYMLVTAPNKTMARRLAASIHKTNPHAAAAGISYATGDPVDLLHAHAAQMAAAACAPLLQHVADAHIALEDSRTSPRRWTTITATAAGQPGKKLGRG